MPIDPTPERRRTPRVDLLADLHGHFVTLDERVLVRQMSAGGMTVETTAPLSPRTAHEFRITLGEATVTIHGEVVHHRVVVKEDVVSYLAGVRFLDVTPDARRALTGFLETVADKGTLGPR